MQVDAAILAALHAIVGPAYVVTDAGDMEKHERDWRGRYRGATSCVVRPGNAAEVAAVVRHCRAAGLAVVPQGGNTGMSGGALPPATLANVVLCLDRMNRVREVDPAGNTMTVEAGCTLAAIQEEAEKARRLFPMALGSQGSCQIGGNVSTNAGGTAVLRYGNTRDLVLGLEVVLPDGRIWDGLRALRKDNTGYDLKHWFIGAEGTLGVITAAVLKLFPRPRDRQTAFVAIPNVMAAVELLAMARDRSGDAVTAFELMPRIGVEFVTRNVPGATDPLAQAYDWYALLELSGGAAPGELRPMLENMLEAAMAAGLVLDAVLAESDAHAKAIWRLREELSDAQKPEGGSIKHDISVPVSKMPEFIEQATRVALAVVPGARPVAFGHIGDGNVHFNLSQPPGADRAAFLDQWETVNETVHDIAASLGGSISAEHGIGRLKRAEIRRYKSPVEMELMQRLKTALDPAGIMNPGKVL